MSSIIEYLPAVSQQYWEFYKKVILPSRPKIIPANATDVSLMPSAIVDKRGLFSQLHIESSSDKLIFTATIDETKIIGSAETVAAAGLVGYYVPGIPWLSNNDSTDGIYVINLNFDPYLPFNKNISLTVSNPTASAIAVQGFEVDAYIFNTGFYKALAEAINGKDLPQSE